MKGEQICMICGSDMKEFEVYDPDTNEQVATEVACPNEWKTTHDRERT
jgi:hypothetical protein